MWPATWRAPRAADVRGARPFAALEALVDRELGADGSAIVVAASGGPDSGALVGLLAAIATKRNLRVTVAHVNHAVRESAWQDECVAAALAARFGLAFAVRSLRPQGESEAELRDLRYAALADMARECAAGIVATGHNAQDQTETVLLALFRGSGLEGLRGMPRTRELEPGCALVRPLLRVSHATLLEYCHAAALPYALDPTNAQPRYRRNAVRLALDAVRHELPALDLAVARTAEIVAAELAGSERSAARRRIRELLRSTGGLADVTFERIEAAVEALARGGSGRIFMKSGVELNVRGSRVTLEPAASPCPAVPPQAPGEADLAGLVFSEEQIAGAVERLAAAIAADYRGQPLLLVGVLKGALFFTVDLARALARRPAGPSDIRMDFLAVSSYGNANRSSGEVRLLKDTSESVEGQNVVIVEDIVDNGLTLGYLQAMFAGRGPATLRSCALLNKPYRRVAQVTIDYVGLECPDEFVVGYGLDYQERYRGLPFVAKLHPSVFQETKG